MDNSEKIINFIDGNLSDSAEKELFNAISMDDSLRLELKNLLSMKNTIKESFNFYEPSLAMTASLYKELNVSLPPNIIEPKINKFGSNIMGFQIKSLLAGALITLLTLLSIYYFYSKYNNSDISRNTDLIKNSNNIEGNSYSNNNFVDKSNLSSKMQEGTQNNQSREKIKNSIGKTNNGFKSNHLFSLNNNKSKDNQAFENSQSIASELNEKIVSPSDISFNNLLDNVNKFDLINKNISLQKIQTEINSQLDSNENHINPKLGISVELVRLINWNLQKATIDPSKSNYFNNSAISLLYQMSDKIEIGTEIRQETFFLKYNGIENQDLKFQYEQQPNFTNYGLIFRYKPINFDKNTISIQTVLGGNYFGYTGWITLNYNYNYDDLITFYIGTDFGVFLYNYQGNIFNSEKFGLNYGIKFKF